MDNTGIMLTYASSCYQQANVIVLANTSLGSSVIQQALGHKGKSETCRTIGSLIIRYKKPTLFVSLFLEGCDAAEIGSLSLCTSSMFFFFKTVMYYS